ncbi:DeoR/GlpR family DNA-binding transcription regulator [Streptococcus suis]|uniref:DeoR/GlpR family DNA-binding transcription regulator n=1 Tax=Streptococcus suis TaxID=1307 RepID=UPI00211D2D48|nr:DeoR/GlpR family DNA-binding transcription regulator [Streptococcus suis]UUM58173.1 DeoR/GlpR family DNA-binding transcription regulator [Streptococcus suis]
MLKSERKQVILEKIKEEQFVRLEELVDILNTSESTVRRDLDDLEAAGKLRRVHGGAEAPANLQLEESIREKSVKNVQEKRQVAEKAAEQIVSGDVIFLDAGTTTGLLIDLLDQENLTVVTNSIHHAVRLVEKQIKTIIIGGNVKSSTDASIGAVALEQLRQLNFDKAFLGMNGVDKDYLTTPDVEEATIKRTVLENAKQPFVLVDSSKFGQYSFVKVARVERVSLITQSRDTVLLDGLRKKTRTIEV